MGCMIRPVMVEVVQGIKDIYWAVNPPDPTMTSNQRIGLTMRASAAVSNIVLTGFDIYPSLYSDTYSESPVDFIKLIRLGHLRAGLGRAGQFT